MKRDGAELHGYVFNRDAEAPEPYLEMFDADGGGPHRVPYADVRTIHFTGQGHRGREVLRRLACPEAGGEGRTGGGPTARRDAGVDLTREGRLLVVAGLALEARGLLRRLPPATRRALTVRIVGPRATLLDRLDIRSGLAGAPPPCS